MNEEDFNPFEEKRFIIKWEKLKLPDEKDEDFEEEDEGYDDSPKFQLAQVFAGGQQNPFFQLKTFDFWTGHTNFKISEPIALIIERVLGVESLELISPYRFHFSVGKLFESQDVKNDISSAVVGFLEQYYEKNTRHE